jgi:hypothetical protein
MLDLNQIYNLGEDVKIGEIVYTVKELTLKNRAQLEKILKDYYETLEKFSADPEALKKEISVKDATDLKFINTALKLMNPDKPELTQENFENLTLSQVIALQEKILQVNNFLPKKGETPKA